MSEYLRRVGRSPLRARPKLVLSTYQDTQPYIESNDETARPWSLARCYETQAENSEGLLAGSAAVVVTTPPTVDTVKLGLNETSPLALMVDVCGSDEGFTFSERARVANHVVKKLQAELGTSGPVQIAVYLVLTPIQGRTLGACKDRHGGHGFALRPLLFITTAESIGPQVQSLKPLRLTSYNAPSENDSVLTVP